MATSQQPQQDFELGYSAAQRNLDSKLAEFQTVQRSAEMQQQFVQDAAIAANRQIANGGVPPGVSQEMLARVQDRPQFTAGMRQGVAEWSEAHQQQTQRQQAVVPQQAQETDQGQREQQQRGSKDLGISI